MTTKTCSKCDIEKDIATHYGSYTDPRTGKKKIRGICKQCRVIIEGERAKDDRPRRNESNKQWKQNNQEMVRDYNRERARLKRNEDVQFKLCSAVSGRTRTAMTAKKQHQYIVLLGCNSIVLKQWLTFQFDENMTWDNYGTYWHVDHVVPLSIFNMQYKSQQLLACHWTNVRPLEGGENRIKSNHLYKEVVLQHVERVRSFTLLHGYQTNIDTCWWQRHNLWYGKNPQDNESYEDFLKWIIRSDDTEEHIIDFLV